MTAWIAIFLVLVFGARTLIGGGLPVVGQLLRIPAPGSLVAQFADGHHVLGGRTAFASTPATLLLGIVGYVLFGSMGLLQTVLVLGCLPFGAFGLARLCRNFANPWAPVVAAACYLAVPLPYDDIATGRLDALFAYAAVPWLMLGLARASELAPFVPAGDATGSASDLKGGFVSRFGRPLRRTLMVGAGLSVLLSFEPTGALVFGLLGAGLAVGILVTGGQGAVRAAARVVATTLGALAVSIVLLAPWSIPILTGASPLDLLAGTRPGPGTSLGWGDILRLSPGPIGMTPVVFGLLAAAALPLLIGRGWRLGWSGRAWICALGAWVFALAVQRGWTGDVAVSPEIFLPIAACGVAMSSALGVSAFRLDLRESRFGWRQIALGVAAAAAVVGAVPVVAATAGGRFDLPPSGFNQALDWMSSGNNGSSQGVLWLGDSSIIPGRAWPFASGLGYSVSSGGIPDLTYLWRGGPTSGDSEVSHDVDLAWAGRTAQLGHLIASHAIRYVVVVGALAPDVPGLQQPAPDPAPASLVSALDAQADLRQLPTEGGYEIYIDPEYTAPAIGTVRAPGGNGIEIAAELVAWVVFAALLVALRRRPGHRSRRPSRLPERAPPRASRSQNGRAARVGRRDSEAVAAATGAGRG